MFEAHLFRHDKVVVRKVQIEGSPDSEMIPDYAIVDCVSIAI